MQLNKTIKRKGTEQKEILKKLKQTKNQII